MPSPLFPPLFMGSTERICLAGEIIGKLNTVEPLGVRGSPGDAVETVNPYK